MRNRLPVPIGIILAQFPSSWSHCSLLWLFGYVLIHSVPLAFHQTTPKPANPTMAAHHQYFREIVDNMFNRWSALQLAVVHGMGGFNGHEVS